jgi:3-hydroxymyristoyl/3-hydroxydecanoyl-(acyl carrier protein) dehydratase
VKFHRPVTPGQQLRLEWQDDAGEAMRLSLRVRVRVRVALHVDQHLVMSAALERCDP